MGEDQLRAAAFAHVRRPGETVTSKDLKPGFVYFQIAEEAK